MTEGYTTTVGLEIHAELKTKTKMFCACRNDPNEKRPNINICPVCMAHPGALPIINKEAVKKVLLVGKALGATLADYSEFDRKNYFYPDIPKGYQISQYAYPLVKGGTLSGITVTRVHLEEDTARSQHEGERSLVDFNRAGVPLMELVTEPVIHSAEEAGAFARELQLLLRYLDVGEANMEKGEMRVEANISVSRTKEFGTKVEVKNLNSFRSVERAITYEVARQIEVVESGGSIVQETRGWDDGRQATFSQRKKESSHDYRYFPEPDLPKLLLSEIPEFSGDVLENALPTLPWKRRAQYAEQGLREDAADLFTRDRSLGELFDRAAEGMSSDGTLLLANYIVSDLAGLREKGDVSDEWLGDIHTAERLRSLITLIQKGTLSSRGAKDTLARMLHDSKDPEDIAREAGLLQQSDEGSLRDLARAVIAAHPQVALEYKAGKGAALQFLIGQGMRQSKGSANPDVLRKLLEEELA